MTAASKPSTARRGTRLAVPTIALLALCSLAACSKTVSATGAGGLNGSGVGVGASSGPTAAANPAVTKTPAPPHTGAPTSTPSTPSTAGGGTPTFRFTLPPHLFFSDCIKYDPATATLADLGAVGIAVTASGESMLVLDNATDAAAALALVRDYSEQCFAGRSNTFSGDERYRHIVQYWAGTGVPGATLPTSDCLSYDNTALAVNNLGADGYQLVAGSEALLLTDTAADANIARSVAAEHHNFCFIGRGNARPERDKYIVEYWI